MEYRFIMDPGMLLSLLGAALAVVGFALGIAMLTDFDMKVRRVLLIAFGIVAVTGNIVALSISEPGRTRTASAIDIAQHFGLESGKEYPLILGDFSTGLNGTVSTQSGLFSASAVVDLQPTTVVSVGFQQEDLWWQLQLPTNSTPFKQAPEGSPATVTIWLNDAAAEPAEAGAQTDSHWEREIANCQLVIRTIWLTRECQVQSETLIVAPDIENKGLSNLVSTNFSHAVITLTPEQHAELFKTN